jgi:hypothetical protein
MVELKLKLDWDHTSETVAMIHNSRMGVKKNQMITGTAINPYRQKKKKRGGKIPIMDIARGFGVK